MRVAVETGGDSSELHGQSVPETLPSETLLPETFPRTEGPGAEAASEPPVVSASVVRVQHHHSLLQAAQSMINIIVVALLIITFAVQPFRIPSESMEPTLLVGDFLLVDKQVGDETRPRIFAPNGEIHRGDLVVFHYPVDSSLHLVKRVIGLPGDRVHLRDDHVYINGRALVEPYAVYRPAAADSYRDDFPRLVSADPGVNSRWWIQMHSLVSNGELTVPADSYFVLGDNRNDSEDSRYWGFVPRAAIVGKPFLIYFSLNDPGSGQDQPSAVAMPGDGTVRHEGVADSLVNFARWDRAMRVIY